MTDNHPITPPPELVQQWLGTYFGTTVTGEVSEVELALATQAARWGANQELKACCKTNWRSSMTDEQIDMLRRLIQDEIEVAGVDGMEHGVWGWMDSQLDKRWKQFQESFND